MAEHRVTNCSPYVQPQHAVVCPVCMGRGVVPYGFYDGIYPYIVRDEATTGGHLTETCRSCGGVGYIVIGYTAIPPAYMCVRKEGDIQ